MAVRVVKSFNVLNVGPHDKICTTSDISISNKPHAGEDLNNFIHKSGPSTFKRIQLMITQTVPMDTAGRQPRRYRRTSADPQHNRLATATKGWPFVLPLTINVRPSSEGVQISGDRRPQTPLS